MIWAVVGGQYGSEGKGAFCAYLARTREFRFAVRGSGPQAGHTFWEPHRQERAVVRQIPVACVVDEHCRGYIGPGAVVDPTVVLEEVKQFPWVRVWIHPAAVVVNSEHRLQEVRLAEMGGIPGTTKEGVGAARALRALRSATSVMDEPLLADLVDANLSAYHDLLHQAQKPSTLVMAEGAQGFGLSLFHGRYPYVTSADTTPAALLSECGLPAIAGLRVTAVLRTFPIRVGGDSGPLHQELTWAEVGREPERTTVTQRERRIGRFDWDLLGRMLAVVRPQECALMFCDYLDAGVAKKTLRDSPAVLDFVRLLQKFLPVRWLGVGGERFSVWEVPDAEA